MAAVTATLAVVASLLTAGSVQAVGGEVAGQRLDLARDPGWISGASSPSELGQAVVGLWTPAADGRTASARLPGGVGSVRVTTAPSDVVVPGETVQMVRAGTTPVASMIYEVPAPDNQNPETVSCAADISNRLGTQVRVGYQEVCGQREFTVTFDRPTVDPILWLGTRAFRSAPTPDVRDPRCYTTWHNTAVVGIDGGGPAADRLDLVSDADSLTSFVDGELAYEFGADPTTCDYILDDPRGYAGVKVSGLVSSVTLRLDHLVMITRVDSSGRSSSSTLGQPDYSLTTSADTVDLSVATTAPATVASGGTVEWTLESANLGPAGSHGFIVEDAVPEQLTDVVLVTAPDGCVLEGRDLSCAVAPPGWSVSQDPDISTLANLSGGDTSSVGEVLEAGATFGPITLRGTAPVTPGTEIVTTAAVSGVDSDLDLSNNSAQTLTTVDAPDWSVAKTVTGSGDTTYPAPGDTLTYTVTATSTTGDVADVVFTDDLTDVLTHADLVPGSVRYTVGSAPEEQLADPTRENPVLVAGPSMLRAGSTATVTYAVVVHDDAWSTELGNTVTATGSGPPSTCAAGASEADPTCSTSTRVTARLDLLKQGHVNGELVGLDGAAFEILADEAGAPGAVLATPVVSPVDGRRGGFEVAGIDPGTYWLRETAAPAGHELLAAPVRFEVAADGTAAVLDAGSAQVVASGGSLTVTDTPSFAMPETGSTGRTALVVTGSVLLAGAALSLRLVRPRARPVPAPVTPAGRRPGS